MSVHSTALAQHEISGLHPKIVSARGPPDDRIWVRPKEAARIAGIGLTRLYELLGSDQLVNRKIGNIRLISVASIRGFSESDRCAPMREHQPWAGWRSRRFSSVAAGKNPLNASQISPSAANGKR